MILSTFCLLAMAALVVSTAGAVWLWRCGGRTLAPEKRFWRSVVWYLYAVVFAFVLSVFAWIWYEEVYCRSPLDQPARIFERR